MSLAELDVACPVCGQTVRVEIVANDADEVNGALRVELLPVWSHECPTPPGEGERLAS